MRGVRRKAARLLSVFPYVPRVHGHGRETQLHDKGAGQPRGVLEKSATLERTDDMKRETLNDELKAIYVSALRRPCTEGAPCRRNEGITRAAIYTARQILHGKLTDLHHVRVSFAAFADGFCTATHG